jgi:alpha-tubulin suppressor-like RCC1 family protein
MNVLNLILNLKAILDKSDSLLEQQMISKAISQLKLGSVEYVTSISELTALSSVTEGKLVFVTGDALYMRSNDNWIPLAQTSVDLLYAWGNNNLGQLGDNTSNSRSSPTPVNGPFTDWCQISTGDSSAGVRKNNTLWTWGSGSSGQLGINIAGSGTNRSSPVSVVGGFTDWCQVCVGESHMIAVRNNGTAWSWGDNSFNQLGSSFASTRCSPVVLDGNITNWCQVSAGGNSSSGVRINGEARFWGRFNWQASYVACIGQTVPAGGFTDWINLQSTNEGHSGLRSNGTVWSWGNNCCGRAGTNENVFSARSSPVQVCGGFTDWCQISLGGGFHGLGLRTNGTAWSWGCNVCGQLGDGTTTARSSPVSVVGGITNWCQVSAGIGFSVALRTDGTAWSWGCNVCGQLGDGTTTARSSPVLVVGGTTDWSKIDAGRGTVMGIRSVTL